MGKTYEKVEYYKEDEKSLLSTFSSKNVNIPETAVQRQAPNKNIHNVEENRSLAIPGSFSGDLEELEERVISMMEKSQNYLGRQGFAQRCKVCGKEGQRMNIKDHIEANHIEGIIIPCNLCDKTFKSRHRLTLHKRQHQS